MCSATISAVALTLARNQDIFLPAMACRLRMQYIPYLYDVGFSLARRNILGRMYATDDKHPHLGIDFN